MNEHKGNKIISDYEWQELRKYLRKRKGRPVKRHHLFIDYKDAKKFAKEHNGIIITETLGTGGKHYKVEYEEEGESDDKTTN